MGAANQDQHVTAPASPGFCPLGIFYLCASNCVIFATPEGYFMLAMVHHELRVPMSRNCNDPGGAS
jgi:hypothetical protein